MRKTRKNLRYAIGALFVAALCALSLCGCANSEDNPYESAMPDDGYVMRNADITLDASAGDRTVRVTETYTFAFFARSQGFYRDIPVNSGEKIRDIRLTNAASFHNTMQVTHEGDFVRIRVGKEGYYLGGEGHTATVSYTLCTPPHAEYPDAMVINAIGQGWSCDIEHASVRVLLPAQTSQTPQYYYGPWGSTKNAQSVVSQKPQAGAREYAFEVTERLSAFEGLTLYYFLPEGALTTRADLSALWVALGGIAVLAAAVLCKLLWGRSPALTPITNYYPPKHAGASEKDLPMDPVDMGYLIDGTCQGSDVTSLIFYFAAQGYLRIRAPEDEKGEFVLEKVCDPPEGLPKYQYTLFQKLFSFGKTVTTSDLSCKAYTAVQSVQTQIAAKYGRKLYDGKITALSWGIAALVLLFSLFVGLIAGWAVSREYVFLLGLTAIAPLLAGMLLGSVAYAQRHKMRPALWYLMTAGICLLTAGLSLLLVLLFPADILSLGARVCLSVAVAAGSLLAPSVRRRTAAYTEELNQVLGFKEFLTAAEKDRLEALLAENPQYYYDILPYANVLGVSDIWQDKFEGLTMEPPRYYRGYTLFDFYIFNRIYRHSYRAYSAATISRPSSSGHSGGGGGFSGGGGGGFSGGGFGGGGGGRW